MRNVGPFFPFIPLASLLQQRTLKNIKMRKGGGQPLFWQGLELFTAVNLQSFKRGQVLKALIVQGFQIWKIVNRKRG